MFDHLFEEIDLPQHLAGIFWVGPEESGGFHIDCIYPNHLSFFAKV